MRRALLLLVVVGLAALLAWWALSGDELDPRAGGGGAVGTAADASGEAARDPAKRARAKSGEDAAADPDAHLPPFLRTWKEVGQDRPQDPSLAAVSGRVLTGSGEAPPMAVVEAVVAGRPTARLRLLGASEFVLRNVPPGTGIGLNVRAEGFAPGGVDELSLQPGVTTKVGTVYLGLAIDPDVANRLVVTVTSEGKPVAGAQITATTMFYGALVSLGGLEKQPGGTILRETTGEDGVATFTKLPPAQYDVFVEAEGLTFDVEQRQTVQRTSDLAVAFDLKPGLTISGRATKPDGTAVEGARVILMRWGSFTSIPPVDTDAEGCFTAKGLTSGSHMLVVAKDEYGAKQIMNVAAGAKDVEVVIEPGQEMAVRALDAATGAPVKVFTVRPFQKTPFAYLFAPALEARTEDGVFRTKLAMAGDWGAEVSAPGYSVASVATVPLAPPAPLDVKLQQAGLVRGRVVSKGTGKPIAGAQVFVKRGGFPPSRMKDQQAATDAAGLFTLDHLAQTPLAIWISHVDHDEASFEGVTPVVRAADGTLPEPRDFQLGSGGRVEGVVRGPGGAPQAGETIQLFVGFDFMSARAATTDAQGKYEFVNVPPGSKYTVSVGTFNPQRGGRSKSDVAVTEGVTTTIDFGTDTGGQRLAGRVTRDVKPAADVTISLVSDDGGQFSGRERTKADGTFAFEHVPAGRYVLRASGGGSRTTSVVVKEAEAPAEVVLALATASIAGRVVDAATGEGLAGVWMDCEQIVERSGSSLSDLVRANRGNFVTEADAAFTFRGLEDGTYQVRTTRDGYGTEILEGIVIANGASKEGLTIRLGPGCTVTGTVRDTAGLPVEGAALQVRDARGRRVFSVSFASSNGDGTFSQAMLAPGEYELTFEKDGFAPATQKVTLSSGAPGKCDFLLRKGARIEVVVRDSLGEPVKDAVVSLLDAAGKVVTRGITLANIFSLDRNRTDAAGKVLLSGLEPGTYRVVVLPPGGAPRAEQPDVVAVEGTQTPVEISVGAAAK